VPHLPGLCGPLAIWSHLDLPFGRKLYDNRPICKSATFINFCSVFHHT
jgi:hypothetical protein